MELSEFFTQIGNCVIDTVKVSKIEKMYGAVLPEIAKKIISYSNKPVFVGEYRVISYSEIVNAEDDLHVPFINKGMIPFVDCMNNDFIVYDFANNIWTKYNIVDRCRFAEQKSLEQLMC